MPHDCRYPQIFDSCGVSAERECAFILLGISVGALFVQLFTMHGDFVHTLVLAAVSGWLVWAGTGASKTIRTQKIKLKA